MSSCHTTPKVQAKAYDRHRSQSYLIHQTRASKFVQILVAPSMRPCCWSLSTEAATCWSRSTRGHRTRCVSLRSGLHMCQICRWMEDSHADLSCRHLVYNMLSTAGRGVPDLCISVARNILSSVAATGRRQTGITLLGTDRTHVVCRSGTWRRSWALMWSRRAHL